jgi:serine/threonine protein kinase
MTTHPATADTEELEFRHFSGELVRAVASCEGQENGVGDLLTARVIRLDDGTVLRQVRVAEGSERQAGYGRLDNEILAGRRLHNVARTEHYPTSVSFLHGDEAQSASPYVLLHPYRGKPLSAVSGQMLDSEQQAFEFSLLTGLCWLAAAGLAHRGLSPSTVRWDHQEHAQITDFSQCTVFGALRSVTSWPAQASGERGPGRKPSGAVTRRDDIYAAGLLIYYVRSQGDGSPPTRDKLTQLGLASLEPVFGPPDGRPTATELLASHLGQPDPVPRRADPLEDGRARFDSLRENKL